ncbi:hypothetical protein QEN19_000691 [Hanseniaspora menglaensis]
MLYNNLSKKVKTGVEFLSNEDIKYDSSIEKVQFLIQKGLSNREILQTLEIFNLRQDKMSDVISDINENYLDIMRDVMYIEEKKRVTKQESEQFYALPPLPPAVPVKDWKDVFIMATASSGVLYGMYHLMQEFILPKIIPKSDNELEKDKNEVQENILKIESKLVEIDTIYHESSEKEFGKFQKLEEVIIKLNRKVDDLEEEKYKIKEDFKQLKLDIKTLSITFDGFIAKNDNSKFLDEMEKEIKSLNDILEFKLEDHEPNNFNQISEKNTPTHKKKNSISFSNLTRPPLFDNSLTISQIPNASDILSKMNLAPLSSSEQNVTNLETQNAAAIKNEIENISMEL